MKKVEKKKGKEVVGTHDFQIEKYVPKVEDVEFDGFGETKEMKESPHIVPNLTKDEISLRYCFLGLLVFVATVGTVVFPNLVCPEVVLVDVIGFYLLYRLGVQHCKDMREFKESDREEVAWNIKMCEEIHQINQIKGM